MNPLRALENRIASLVEGAFGRMFRSEVRPIELAHKLAREMDEHRTESVSRTYAPNEYSVWLSPEDRAHYEGVEHEVIEELCAYLLEHARREDLILASQPLISFHTDEELSLGEFGIQARLVRVEGQEETRAPSPAPPPASAPVSPPASSFPNPASPPRRASSPVPASPPAPAPTSAPAPPAPESVPSGRSGEEEHGRTMIYSSSARMREPLEQARASRPPRALLAIGGRRLSLPPTGGVVGRSRECDVVLEDTGVSRRHAELRPDGNGWMVTDLGSTNGVRVNGRIVRGAQRLQPGDRLELGSTEVLFDLA